MGVYLEGGLEHTKETDIYLDEPCTFLPHGVQRRRHQAVPLGERQRNVGGGVG